METPAVAGVLYILVPTVRLELTRPKPLPPQDSVSTNFTTSAYFVQRENYTTFSALRKVILIPTAGWT